MTTLLDYIREVNDLTAACGLLGWDQDTHMPPKGAESRARTLALLERDLHRKMCDTQLADLAQEALTSGDEISREVAQAWLQCHVDTLKVPETLASALAEVGSLSNSAWHTATTFEEMLPHLEKLIDLNKQYAACYPDYRPYDTLIDGFDPDLNQAFLDKAFAVLKPGLLALRSGVAPSKPLHKASASELQLLHLTRQMTEWMGFDYSRGNLTTTEHPFMTSINRDDVRIATKIHKDHPLATIGGGVHEAGHGIYEQNAAHTEIGFSLDSSALHECNSLFWEVMFGKSPLFWSKWITPLNSAVGFRYGTTEDIIDDLRHYDPSNVIRLEAGDLDYGLHIILRYELERELFEGGLQVKNMKARFNELCVEYFGREPKDDRREGVLQDVHWSCGLYGYFPSYLLGVSLAAQLWRAKPADVTEPKDILAYLNVMHQHGGRYSFETLTDTLGGYDPQHYLQYLRDAYLIK